jgi:nicotinate-nucleotide adenylyltransferase
MRIALFGGSFNPIHNKHVELVEKVLKDNLADEVWIVPCGNHAFNKALVPAKNRIEMINLALSGRDNVRVEKYEIERQGVSYAYDTLMALKKRNPNDSFMLIIGSDILGEIERWHEFEKLKKEAKFIVFHRADYDIIDKGLNIVSVDEGNLSNLSSTIVREYTKQGKSIEGLVPREVAQYIKANKLYLN